MIQKSKKKGPGGGRTGRPPTVEADKLISWRLPESLLDQADDAAAKEGVSRSDVLREAVANYVTPDEAARRKAERLQFLEKALDQLGHTGPAREAAIQRLLAGRLITADVARELMKTKRK